MFLHHFFQSDFFFVINFLSHINKIWFFSPTESGVYLFDLQIMQNCLFSILDTGLLPTGSLIQLVSFLKTFVQILKSVIAPLELITNRLSPQ